MHSSHHIIYIMGVSGSGKTTVGKMLSAKTGLPFFDADEFHPPANIEKLKAGIPLTDEDRLGWLKKINALAKEQVMKKGAIIACSALKENYRHLLENELKDRVWIYLQGSFQMILDRMQKRTGHFMPASLLQSQFDTLEIPVNALSIPIEKSPEDITAIILQYMKNSMK